MLFPYVYVPHPMDKMQEYVDFIFYNVWCVAPWEKYSISLFDANNELREIIEGLHNTEPKGADFFIQGIQVIFNEFEKFNALDIWRVRRWYGYNNDIAGVCKNDIRIHPIRYRLLKKIFQKRYGTLEVQLKNFFMNLYSNTFLSLKIIREKIGSIDDHYHAFVKKNMKGKCPFCGIHDIKDNYHSKRDAYDHYLPKGIYPFNSINFKNLAPACHECNSSYKLANDPLFSKVYGKRKAFYPYAANSHKIELSLKLGCEDWSNINPQDIEIIFGPEQLQEQINTWDDVYGIQERYKAKCCGENDGKYWIEQVLDEWQEDDRNPEDFFKTLSRNAEKKPYAEANFLKEPFLKACKEAGLFNDL